MRYDQLAERLERLDKKLKRLVADNNTLRKENEALKQETSRLSSVIEVKERELDDFQNKINISTIVSNVGVGNTDTSELKALIDDYINEIDRCVIHLSR
ncbi:hypothetical protein FUAX_31110 [Fulvitalea axinellae]|uniref:Uncharacterized protein n=1 Tax=Fulvitalea axinellae TaxID=1182444 RepID=A0AAU9CES9_9BACT|nr:hypothetical protein FUAX_31110 [Fulvitalea axinellae]